MSHRVFLNASRMGLVQDTHPIPITLFLSCTGKSNIITLQASFNLELDYFPQVSVKAEAEAWLEKLQSTEKSSPQPSSVSCLMKEVSVFEYQPSHLLLADTLITSFLVFLENVKLKRCLKYVMQLSLVGDIEEDLDVVAILLEKMGFILSVRCSAAEK